jgi:putative ABC transport system permease protein
MRRSLIVAQVALSLVLLSTGGLVVRSFERLLSADPGFNPEGVLTFSLGLGDWLFEKDTDSYAFQNRVDAAILALPGVSGVSATTALPITGDGNITRIRFPGTPGATGVTDHGNILVRRIFTRPGYISTMGMRLLAGRDFDVKQVDGVREAIIDHHLAERFFPNRSPLGATLRHLDQSTTIVGVVEQPRMQHLYQDDDFPQFFVRGQDYEGAGFRPSWVVVHTNRDPLALMPEVRAAIRQVDRRPPVSHVRTMEEIVADRRSRERISAVLISGLALGALLLVSMGLFGVVSGSVTRRRGELAVRLALGATHGRVLRLVVGEGARLIVLGLLIGIPGVYMAGHALKGFLVGVSPFDTPTLAVIAIGLVTVTLLACYLGARRVTSIQPARLLNEE